MKNIFRDSNPGSTLAMIFVFIVLLGMITVMLLSAFTELVELSLGWFYLSVGASWLSITALYDRSLAVDKKRKMNVNMEAALINLGLAMISDSVILTWFFSIQAGLCFLLWSEHVIKGLVKNLRRADEV